MKRQAAKRNHEYKRFYLRHAVPVAVWLVAVTSVVWLFYQRAQRFEVVGIARGQVLQISPSSTGRIRDIPIALYQPVSVGQTLAVVDTILDNEQTLTAELKAELAGVTAEIEHLAAQLIPTQELMQAETHNLEISRTGDLGRLAVDLDNYRLRVLQLQGSIAADEIALGDLAAERNTCEKLLEEGAIAPYELDKAKVRYAGLARKVEEDSRLLAQAKADMAEAEKRLEQFAQQQVAEPSVDQALEVIRKEIKVQEELMSGLLERLTALKSREAVELKSPIDGVVIPIPTPQNDALQRRPGEQVMRRVGEVVTAGDPILAVAEREPTEIVAYVGEQQLGFLKENMSVELVKARTPAQLARSQIASIGPTIELVPQRLWRNPTIPQWGRPVLIDIPPGLSLVPGEIVGIRGL
jgi:multidrug resistance efflux pump